MSVLRFLAPQRYSGRATSPSPSSSRSQSKSRSKSHSTARSKSRHAAPQPRISIRMPSYGSVFMDASHQGTRISEEHDEGPSTRVGNGGVEREARGELEIEIPKELGRVRVKSIRVGLRTETELTINMMRVKEKDEIFKREVEITGEEGIVLEEGFQRFDFVLLIPNNLCSHDRHPNGKIMHNLYAELEGIDDTNPSGRSTSSRKSTNTTTTSSNLSNNFSSLPTTQSPNSTTPNGNGNGTISPPSGSQDRTPTYYAESTTRSPASPISPDSNFGAVNPASLTSALNSMRLERDGEAGPSRPQRGFSTNSVNGRNGGELMPPAPPYSADDGEKNSSEAPWFKGIIKKERLIELLHNCHPEGGVTELEVVVQDAVPGLGPFELKLESDCWTIGALLFGTLNLMGPSPNVTVFSFRVSLIQTHSIRSPRDDPTTTEPTVTKTVYPIFTMGDRPMQGDKYPGPRVKALWRGKAAGGTDEGEGLIRGRGRMPHESKARASSVRNVPTPITVTHKLGIEVLFAVWGEDEQGNKMAGNGPGALRALMVEKGTMVASCAFTPEELRLPTYGSLHDDAFSHLSRKCPLCGMDPPDKLCPTCPPTSVPHPRHDHPPKLVGNEQGICPLCADSVVPKGAATMEDCACGMPEAYLIERFERRKKGQDAIITSGGVAEMRGRKAEVERGRRM